MKIKKGTVAFLALASFNIPMLLISFNLYAIASIVFFSIAAYFHQTKG